MAFSSNNYEQLGLTDRTLLLNDKERKLLDDSWSGAFARDIFPRIDEKIFAILYSQESASPSSPVNVIVGLMLLEEIFGTTDEEAVQNLVCDLRYQAALHTTSAVVQPVSLRTLGRFRKRCADYMKESGISLLGNCIHAIESELNTYLSTYFSDSELDAGILSASVARLRASGDFDYAIVSDPETFKVGNMPAHSDHIAYPSREEMDQDPEGEGFTSLRFSLNGVWKFAYAKNYDLAIRGFEKTSYDCSSWDEIRVPAHMQLEGYDIPAYVNYQYPWDGREELKEGSVPKTYNPVGSYVRYFRVPDNMQGRPVYISFQGVESGYALYLNGSFVGYSEDTFTPTEFDLTPYLVEGENKLAVRVFKWTSSSWLEDQDFYRFSGIFRDVYLFTVPDVHIYDLKIRTLLDDRYEDAELVVNTDMSAVLDHEIAGADQAEDVSSRHVFGFTRYELRFHDRVVISGEIDNEKENEIREKVASPRLWSAEEPNLYDLYLYVHAKTGEMVECVHERVGFRRFEMKNGLMLLNGKRIVFNGVNRHEFNCDTGRAGMTREMVIQDLTLMKRNNINAIRTCHYPDDSRLYRLCDEYGLYLIAENNMETHGSWASYEMGVSPKEDIIPGDKACWKEVLLDRINSCYQRDKNHPAILIWSVGNESNGGEVIYQMSRLFKQLDPDRLVHYEGVCHDRTYNVTSDMESQMYPSVQMIRDFLKEHTDKPFICCEYTHSMGNSNGAMFKYTDLANEEPRYQGGFIWDFVDQSLRMRDRYGVEFQAYGGDCGERPTDYSFSGDGIVAGDRMEYPKLQDVKFNYQNISAELTENQVRVINRNLFVNTDSFDCVVILKKDGSQIRKEELHTDVAPLSEKTYDLPFALPNESGEYTIIVSFLLKEDTLWAEKGYEIAFGQGVFSVKSETLSVRDRMRAQEEELLAREEADHFKVIRGNYNMGVHGLNFDALLSFLNGGQLEGGGLTSYRYAGQEMMTITPHPNFWRALTDNDKGNQLGARYGQWKLASLYHHLMAAEPVDAPRTQGFPRIMPHRNRLAVTLKYLLNTAPQSECLVTYTLMADGSVKIEMDYDPVEGLPPMPEFGMLFHLDADYNQVTFYGNGPEETYCDRDRGAKLGIYEETAGDAMTRYLVPQECGNHTGVRWAKVTDRKGRGLLFTAPEGSPVNFSALPYTPDEIENAYHHTELPPVHYTIVRISLMQMGVAGDDSWQARTHEEFLLDNKNHLHFEFTFRGI